MAEVDNTTPERQAYLATLQDTKLRGRFAANIANVRLFKSNPYIKDLPEADMLEANKSLLTPYQGEMFYDDDGYKYICKITKNELTGETQYNYISKEKENAEKLKEYQSTGVQNQLMSAYNNGRVYTLYIDRTNLMMYPNQSLIFPEEFAFYTVRKQELNKNKEFVYVAGVMDSAGQLSDMHIAMKKVVDTANNTTYTRMSPASVFEVTNPSEDARFDQLKSGEFYVVEFYNKDGFIIDTKLFQAQDSLITNTALPSQSVKSIKVSVIRGGEIQESGNGVYPILAGENLEDAISYSVRAIYNDGTTKVITDKLDTAQLTRSWGTTIPDTTSANVGDQFICTFTYFPNLDEEKEIMGNSISETVTFQVIENTKDKLYKIIPVVWLANSTNFSGDGIAQAKIYNLKVYKMDTNGAITNCTRAFYNTFKVKKNNEWVNYSGVMDYDPYNQYCTFIWGSTDVATTETFKFGLYNSGALTQYQFQVDFGKNESDSNGRYVKAATGDGYEENGPLSTLSETYGYSSGTNLGNVIKIAIRTNNWNFGLKSYTGEELSTRYKRSINGTIRKANSVQLFAVKDASYTPISRIFTFGASDTDITIPSINNDASVLSIIEGLKQYDWILAKFFNSEAGSGDVLVNFDVFAVSKTF